MPAGMYYGPACLGTMLCSEALSHLLVNDQTTAVSQRPQTGPFASLAYSLQVFNQSSFRWGNWGGGSSDIKCLRWDRVLYLSDFQGCDQNI